VEFRCAGPTSEEFEYSPPSISPATHARARHFGNENPLSASDKGCEPNGEHAGAATNIEQDFVPSQADLLRDFLKEPWRIGFR
jgi:hypothetical protein